jgi:HipA-like C-terminal domain
MKRKLTNTPIINHSGFKVPNLLSIPVLRPRNYYTIEDVSMSGDRPKDFIKIYEYDATKQKQCTRQNPKTWIPYLAKVGDKWYPCESITEYLLNRIGEIVGMNMAKSKLYLVAGQNKSNYQMRFCSRYFLSKNEELIHGVQIYENYFRDKDFVKMVENQKMEHTLFTFQEAEKAIRDIFKGDSESILKDFVKMLIFDALIGNNDRHFYNWGVIVDLRGKYNPRLSPIFDTARGFFWNDSEKKLIKVLSEKNRIDTFMNTYVKNSQPKTSWDNETEINHIKLVQLLKDNYPNLVSHSEHLFNQNHLQSIEKLLRDEFANLLTPQRLMLIQKCLTLRFNILSAIIHN